MVVVVIIIKLLFSLDYVVNESTVNRVWNGKSSVNLINSALALIVLFVWMFCSLHAMVTRLGNELIIIV